MPAISHLPFRLVFSTIPFTGKETEAQRVKGLLRFTQSGAGPRVPGKQGSCRAGVKRDGEEKENVQHGFPGDAGCPQPLSPKTNNNYNPQHRQTLEVALHFQGRGRGPGSLLRLWSQQCCVLASTLPTVECWTNDPPVSSSVK